MKTLFTVILIWLATTHFSHAITMQEEVQRLGSRAAVMRHYNPAPASGTWVAFYSQPFADAFGLPHTGVRHDLEYMQYIELVSVKIHDIDNYIQKEKDAGRWEYPDETCYINILMSHDNDISLAGWHQNEFQKERINFHFRDLEKPIQALKLNKFKATYRSVFAFDSPAVIHSHDLLRGYDYFSLRTPLGCQNLLAAYRNKAPLKFTGIPRTSAFDQYILDPDTMQKKADKNNPEWYRTVSIPYDLIASFYFGVSAGTLTPTDDDVVETINLATEMVKNPADTYCVRVQGDSMINAGIEEGDILVVDKRIQARHGDIIIANVDGDSTVKRLLIGKDGIILQPENERHKPIQVNGLAAFQNMGVVQRVIKSSF